MKNKAIYIEMDGCQQCIAAKPKFAEECKRLGIEITYKEATAREDTELGEIRHLPYAIVSYNGKTIKGGAWDVWDALKGIELTDEEIEDRCSRMSFDGMGEYIEQVKDPEVKARLWELYKRRYHEEND